MSERQWTPRRTGDRRDSVPANSTGLVLSTSVGEVGDVRLGTTAFSEESFDADIPTKYIRAANITWTGLISDDVLDMEFQPTELRQSSAPTRRRALVGSIRELRAKSANRRSGTANIEDCCFQNTVIRVPTKVCLLEVRVLSYCCTSPEAASSHRVSKGVGIHHLSADRFASMPFFATAVERTTPHRRQDRGTVLRPGCRRCGPGAGEGESEALPCRRPQSRRRRQAHRRVAGQASQHRTGLETPRTHPDRTPQEMGSRPTRQIRRRRQRAAEELAGEVRRADAA